MDVYVLRIAGEKFVHGDAFEHGGARPGAFSVRFHRLQGILDLVGDAPFGLFVGMAVAVPRTFFVLFSIRVLCLGVLVTMGGPRPRKCPGGYVPGTSCQAPVDLEELTEPLPCRRCS